MIDVGAHYGGSLLAFASTGWRVLAVEPDPANRLRLEENVEHYRDVVVIPVAISDENSDDVPFYTSEVSTGISGLLDFHESHKEAFRTRVTTLEAVMEQWDTDGVDFLKIDTEGVDLKVLKGFPWEKTSPRVVMCEFEDQKTVRLGYNFHDLATYLVDHGYYVLVSEWFPVVRYGGRHRWRRFVEYPCDLIDSSAWGNLIAIKDHKVYETLLGRVSLSRPS